MTNLGIMERARKLLGAAGRRAWKQGEENQRAAAASTRKRGNENAQLNPQPIWMKTEARVTDCRHELVRMSALIRRIKNGERFVVSFIYYAHARTYYENFISPVARTQGQTFSIYYNALNPRHNAFSPSKSVTRHRLSDTAILSIILVSIIFLAMASG
jgi:hypothetical protein